MATETVLLAAAARGGDRQLLHERLRVLSREAGRRVKEEGEPNPLLDMIAGDDAFGLDRVSLLDLMQAGNFVGRAPEQVDEFLAEVVDPWLADHPTAAAHEEPQV